MVVARAQLLNDIDNSDLIAPRNEYHFTTPVLVPALAKFLKDPRDLPMVCLQVNIVLYLSLGVSLVYYVNLAQPAFSLFTKNLVGVVYVVGVVLLFLERFLLMLHFSSHLAIYSNDILNAIPNWVLCPFFGVPCGLYKVHHVVMHHIENNHDYDVSSTEFYQRDSWVDFGKYWFRFTMLIWLELPYYTFRTKKYDRCIMTILGLTVWSTSIFLLSAYVSTRATFWTLILPHIIAMSAMSFGNWSQHIFVDSTKPESNYGLAYNCMDTPVNQTTFNDGYHIIHHANARLHWTEMPGKFYSTVDKHVETGALTFRKLHFVDVGILVMTKNLKKLAEHYVHLGPAEKAPTLEVVEERLRSWLKPIAPVKSASSKKFS